MVHRQDLLNSQQTKLYKILSICIINDADILENDKEFDRDDSSIESEFQNINSSENIESSESTNLANILPEIQKLFKKRNKPLVQYAISQFKNLFGTIGEEVQNNNLLQNETELLEDTSEQLLHRKIFYDESHNQVVIISVYLLENLKFKIFLKEPTSDKECKLVISKEKILTKADMETLDLNSHEALKTLAVSIIEERVTFKKSEREGYKMEVLPMKVLEENQEEKESSDGKEKKEIKNEENAKAANELQRVKTITEEVDSSHS